MDSHQPAEAGIKRTDDLDPIIGIGVATAVMLLIEALLALALYERLVAELAQYRHPFGV